MGMSESYGLVSDKDVSKMCHCVGYNKKKVYHRNGKAYFKPHRNYFYAGGSDIELWERLVEIGIADKNKNGNAGDKNIYYWLNKRGLDMLSYLLNVYIYSESASGNEIDASEDVIEVLLEDEVYCGYECWLPSSAKDIAFRARLPRKLTIDTLHYLRDKCGYVKNDSYGDIDSDGFPRCTHGWSITKKWLDEHRERFEAARKHEYDRIDLILRGCEENDNCS